MILQIILVQLIVAGIILFVLKTVLEHELLVYALECLEGFEPAAGGSVKEVTVLVGRVLSDKMTCRLQGVDPCTYLVDVLQRVSVYPDKDILDLTPRRWKEMFAHDPIRSIVDIVPA